MLTVSGVSKTYGGKRLFEDVTTTFDPGHRYGLTGANGAGKSTFMKILAGELEPDHGDVTRPARSRLSMLHQDHYRFEKQRIRDVVGDAPVYLTIDIDFLDPAFAPGTGTPVCGGPSTRQARALLHALAGINLVGADLVEVAPPYDPAGVTALAGATLSFDLLSLLALGRERRQEG